MSDATASARRSNARPPAVPNLTQEAQTVGVEGQISQAPIINVIESNRQIALREYPDQVDKNYEWTTLVKPAIQVKRGDAIMVSNVFINQRGSSSDVLDFTSEEGNINQNNKTKCIFSMYATDDGTAGKRRAIDIAGLTTYVFNQYNSYNSMKLERFEFSNLQIFPEDFTDDNMDLWYEYYGNYQGTMFAEVESICLSKQDPYCDNRWFNTLGGDFVDYDGAYTSYLLTTNFHKFKMYGWTAGKTDDLKIESLLAGGTPNPGDTIKAGDTFLIEAFPDNITDALNVAFPSGQLLQCSAISYATKIITIPAAVANASIPYASVGVPLGAQTISGGVTIGVNVGQEAILSAGKYLVQVDDGSPAVMDPALNYKIVSYVLGTLTLSSAFTADYTNQQFYVQTFAPNRDAAADTDAPSFKMRLSNLGMSGMNSLGINDDMARGWNMDNLLKDKQEVYEYRINRLNAGTGFGDNINTFNEYQPTINQDTTMGVVDGFTKFNSHKKAVYYDLSANNPYNDPLLGAGGNFDIVPIGGTPQEKVLQQPFSSEDNPWQQSATYTTNTQPFVGILTTAQTSLRNSINPKTGLKFRNYEGIWFQDFRRTPSYIWTLNVDGNVELYNYSFPYDLVKTLTNTKANPKQFPTPEYTSPEMVVFDQDTYVDHFWSNNTTLDGTLTTPIGAADNDFSIDFDVASVYKQHDGLFSSNGRVLNHNARFNILITSPDGQKSEIFYIQQGSFSVNVYPRANAQANFSTITQTIYKTASFTNAKRSFESRTGDGVYPVGSSVKLLDVAYHASPKVRIFNMSYSLYGKANNWGVIISPQSPDFVRQNFRLFSNNLNAGFGAFQAKNQAAYVRTRSAPQPIWVEHLFSHTLDLGDATNLSPSDVGSIITAGFQTPDDLRITREKLSTLTTPRPYRLGGLKIKQSKVSAVYMNKFYQNCSDAYFPFTEDASQFSGRAAGTPQQNGFRFKMRYKDTPVFHNRTPTAYSPYDGYYFDSISDPQYPSKNDGDHFNGDFFVYIRSQHTGLNVVDGGAFGLFREGTMTTTPTGNMTYSKVTIPFPVKSANYPVVVSSDSHWFVEAGHMVGASSATLNFNVNFSRFEFELFHQPYINPVKNVGTAVTGGETSAFMIYPMTNIFQPAGTDKHRLSPYTNSMWGRFSGVNVMNWSTKLQTYSNFRDFYNALGFYDVTDTSPSAMDPTGVRFMKKIGYTDAFLQKVSWDGGRQMMNTPNTNDLKFFQPLATTNNKVDISNTFIPSDEAPTNFARPNQTNNGAAGAVNVITIPESFQQGSYGGIGSGFGFIPGSGAEYDQLGSLNNNHMGGNLPPTTGEPLLFNAAATSGTYQIEPDFNPDCRLFMGYTIDADTDSLQAELLPEKNNSPYYLLLCPEIAGNNNFYSTRASGSVSPNVCSIVSRLNAEQDFVFSYQSPLTFYAKQDIILSAITCKILQPDYSAPTNLSANSSVIFQIVRENPQPPYIQPTFTAIQNDAYQQLAVREQTMRHLTQAQHQSKRDVVNEISDMLASAGFTPTVDEQSSLLTRVADLGQQAGINNMTPAQIRSFMASDPRAPQMIALLGQIRSMSANVPPVPTATSDDIADPLEAVLNIPFEQITPDDPEYALTGQSPPSPPPVGLVVPDTPVQATTPRSAARLAAIQRGREAIARAGYTPEDIAKMEEFGARMKFGEKIENLRKAVSRVVTPQQEQFALAGKKPDDSGVGTMDPTRAATREGTVSPPPIGDLTQGAAGAEDVPERPEEPPPEYDPGFAIIPGRQMVDENNNIIQEEDLAVRQLDTDPDKEPKYLFRATRIPLGGYGTAHEGSEFPVLDPVKHGYTGTRATEQINKVYGDRSVYAAGNAESAHRFILEGLNVVRGREQNKREYDIHRIDITGLPVTPIYGEGGEKITERFALQDDNPYVFSPSVQEAIKRRAKAYQDGMVQLNREHVIDAGEGGISPERITHVKRLDYTEDGDDPSKHPFYKAVMAGNDKHRAALKQQFQAIAIRQAELADA